MIRRSPRSLRTRLAMLVAACLLVALPASATWAQGPAITIDSASLRLWPEYDDPGLLVILSGDLAEGTALPQTIAIPIPQDARNIQATFRDETGNLLTRDWEVTDGKLTYELPTRGFHVEFYVDRPPSGEARDIQYAFEAPYPIDALEIGVQEPARSTGFSMTPEAGTSFEGNDGLTYHVASLTGVAAGQQVPVAIRYSKTDTGLSAPQLAVTGNEAAGVPVQGAAPAAQSANWLAYILIGAGIALLFGALAYWLLMQRRAGAAVKAKQPAPAKRPVTRAVPVTPKPAAGTVSRGQAAAQAAVHSPVAAGAAAFCTQCGNPMQVDDRFCSQCGTPRK